MDQKLPPYQRLKLILNEGNEQLTKKGNKNLEELLDIKQDKSTLYTKIIKFFLKIDQVIFSRRNYSYNKYRRRRN